MRVERAGLDSVKERLEALKRKASSTTSSSGTAKITIELTKEQIEKEEQDKQEFKRRRKEEKKKQKSEKKQGNNPWSDGEDILELQSEESVTLIKAKETSLVDADDEENVDLEKILGFKGFGTTKR